ncbi:hypothetical protein Pse7367_0651 [Thalassoporum mexicanum PCC 7367]|uniref:(2Fe-2S) ferredoxin domain-containing protein n=1 Tax=Thalassoporum mexicanum TaxID=3457544 RepID=UPI00029FA4EE|nr:(2Fe-2S) ferredoxin domain-containing protein [Pseudanabaena sp. PCC 7367]AFY68954.1 hypothetical protein Pse7367_0651 [Pseudanabaena sp. PCC 7367]
MAKKSKLLDKPKSKSVAKKSISKDSKTIEGIYLDGLRSKKGRLKWLRLETEHGEIVVKVAKDIASDLPPQIQVGDRLKLAVARKDSYLKAIQIMPIGQAINATALEFPAQVAEPQNKTQPQIKLKICRKGSCCKRGSKDVIKAMEAAIETHNLGDRVTIETTGCMDRCKKGPNIKALPEGEWYSRVNPDQAEDILRELQAIDRS